MKTKKHLNIKNENGEIVVESTMVFLVVIFVTFFLLNMAMAVYHNELIVVEANRVATDVANNYGDKYKDPIYQYQDESYFKKCEPYRYLIGWNSLKENNKKKAKWYAGYLLSQHEMADEITKSWDNIVVNVSENALGMTMLEVKITRKYNALAMAPMALLNVDTTYTVSATGKAICYDVIHDMSKAELKQDLINKLVGASALLQGISNVEVIIDSVKNLTD